MRPNDRAQRMGPGVAGTKMVLAFTHTPIRRMSLIFVTRCRY